MLSRRPRVAGLRLVLLLACALGAGSTEAVRGDGVVSPGFSADLGRGLPQGAIVPRAYLPLVSRAISSPQDANDVAAYVNYYRAIVGSPPVTFDTQLDLNCTYHARYVAEEGHLTHDERTDSPWYTPEGQACAQNSNVWMGSAFYMPYWEPHHAIESWMSSVGHRLWLLYPTTPTFGYGFYAASNNRAGAALDVLSTFNSSADLAYPGWPVRYPATGQGDIPAEQYPITINWRYFGPTPTVSATSLQVVGGASIAHSVTTHSPVGHKMIAITPDGALPAQSTIAVSVSGIYDGVPFTYSWQFSTGQ